MDLARVRARYFAAIAAGIAACHPEAKPVETTPTLTPTTTETAPATATATAPATATATATATETATAPATATTPATATAPTPARVPSFAAGKLKCTHGKLAHQCYPPKAPPPTGGGGPAMMTPSYTAFDKNGCFAEGELVGTCLGTEAASGPFIEKGQCCFDVCGGIPVPCGRPLFVEGSARVARTTPRTDWTGHVSMDVAHNRSAALAWRDDAALEHASIASFAKLALELLALGAPPELVAAASNAALEEIEHAKICFAIAARLGHDRVGPAPLSLDGLSIQAALADVAVETARQSCVGETVAGLALARASELCAPELAPVLAKMAEDELGHAALGWRIVAWACQKGGLAVRERIAEALVVGDYAAPVMNDASEWHRCGRIECSDMSAIVEDARVLVRDSYARI